MAIFTANSGDRGQFRAERESGADFLVSPFDINLGQERKYMRPLIAVSSMTSGSKANRPTLRSASR